MEPLESDNVVTFTINGKIYRMDGKVVTAEMSLLTFLREYAQLSGTKYMCKEGGCGSCTVALTFTHPVTKQDVTHAVNSCLVPVLSCQGVAITTVEGIGNKVKGYHPVQSVLAKFNGTQCGYCSPGMVMNMYSLLKCKPNVTMKEVENSFGGVICRCTGYRPILDAWKSLANDATDELKQQIVDIEDLMREKCKLNEGKCNRSCETCRTKVCEDEDDNSNDYIETALAPKSLKIKVGPHKLWYKANSVFEILQIFDLIQDNSYMLVAGNTAQGVYPVPLEQRPIVYIEIHEIAELKQFTIQNDHIELGANITLTDTMNLFSVISQENPLMFGYLKVLVDHIDLVANVAVRNRATIAGNLMIKHEHNEFQSDIFLLLELSGATLTIHDSTGLNNSYSMLEFLNLPMYKKVITSIIFPAISSNHYTMRSFKIMPRSQNVHALVNAGFLFRLDKKSYIVEETPKIIYGAINPQFVHAYKTESFIAGKQLLHPKVLQHALDILASELAPNPNPPEASPAYRKKLALSLFYKFVLAINPTIVSKKFRSGGPLLHRPLSSGKQDFSTNPKTWPVNKPVQKLEAMAQCSGEAVYVDDIPKQPNELYGALVITDQGNTTIKSIDPSKALNIPGVVAFYSAKDIPGQNSFITLTPLTTEMEEIFCSGKVIHNHQPVGVIVAESPELAEEAAKHVVINYGPRTKPLLTIKEVLKSGDPSRKMVQFTIERVRTGADIEYKITGEIELQDQYHFTLELQNALCIPQEDTMKIYCATQWMTNIQASVASALDIPENMVDVEVKRVGGAYGCKITRCSQVANACALAAFKLNRPVRMVLDMKTNMRAIGKRNPFYATYEVAVNGKGEIQYLNMEAYSDYGVSYNEAVWIFISEGLKSTYDFTTWKVNIYGVKTDHVSRVWTRAPGTLEGMTAIEHIMEHIAHVVKMEPLDVKMANVSIKEKPTIMEMWEILKKSSDYEKRNSIVKQINSENRWKKRGISVMPMKFDIIFFSGYHCLVSIYGDGTVAITHGGAEIGQGINTKAAQVVAYALGVDLDMVKVKPTLSVTVPNNFATGGSIASDCVCAAALRCCEILNTRLKPIRNKFTDAKWPEIIKNAILTGIDLCAHHMYSMLTDPIPNKYSVYGITVLEVEMDALTGQYQILRVDIHQDAGESLSPNIDIGQVEGAFVMGLGYFHCEEIIYDQDGRNLTDRTWTYHPPGAKDIPIDLRVKLRKNSQNPLGVLRSKATGEPPLCMSSTLMHALKQAVRSVRLDAGFKDEWFTYEQPCTFERTLMTAGTDHKQFML